MKCESLRKSEREGREIEKEGYGEKMKQNETEFYCQLMKSTTWHSLNDRQSHQMNKNCVDCVTAFTRYARLNIFVQASDFYV